MHTELENLVNNLLSKGEITERSRELLMKKAEQLGVDAIDFELELEGRIAETKTKTTAPPPPTSNKEGSLKKCPSCGSVAESFSTTCKDCGHEFRNIQTVGSIQKLFEMLNELESSRKEDSSNPLLAMGKAYSNMFSGKAMFGGGKFESQKSEIIKNFPVPNTKEDLLEFLSLAVPKSKKKGGFWGGSGVEVPEIQAHNALVPTWKAKCEQIIMKARFSMKDDKKTLEEIESYAKQLGI